MSMMVKRILILSGLLLILVLPSFVSAALPSDKLRIVGEGSYMPITDNSPNSLAGIVGIGIQAFLGLLGIIFLILIIYAGYNWMTAQGEEEKVTKAKDTLQRAVIGLIIVIGAYAISYFVIDRLVFSSGIIK